ncbi:MAG TPA: hypothetical protein VF158_02550 [Longimicrobiales bacterium]
MRPISRSVLVSLVAGALLLAGAVDGAAQQRPAGEEGSRNVHVLSHVPLGAPLTVSDVELEQELSRPFAYVGRMFVHGFDIIDLRDPENASVLYRWRIENAALHQGTGMMDGKQFKHGGRYYYVQSTQFGQGGPDSDLGAIVFDVTGLPDVSKLKEVARIRAPDLPGGFHNIFIYKHSDGRPLLITTTSGPQANIYDLSAVIRGRDGLIGKVPVPEGMSDPFGTGGFYHDMYAAYDPATGKDKFYGGGSGGYHVYDISTPENPVHLFSITGMPLVPWGHTFTPTPDGKYAVGEVEHQYAPLRIFDLQPGQSGQTRTINHSIGAWTANWKNLSHNHEVRWPFVFVSAYEDGLQIFNMMDPTDPYTVGFYDTYSGPPAVGMCADRKCNGAFGVDVRNADGLIVISDMTTGFWAFRMDGFQGWNGEDWGMPNISSVQDWDNGPVRRADVTTDQDDD